MREIQFKTDSVHITISIIIYFVTIFGDDEGIRTTPYTYKVEAWTRKVVISGDSREQWNTFRSDGGGGYLQRVGEIAWNVVREI